MSYVITPFGHISSTNSTTTTAFQTRVLDSITSADLDNGLIQLTFNFSDGSSQVVQHNLVSDSLIDLNKLVLSGPNYIDKLSVSDNNDLEILTVDTTNNLVKTSNLEATTKLNITGTNYTDKLTVKNVSNTDILSVDTTNSIVKATNLEASTFYTQDFVYITNGAETGTGFTGDSHLVFERAVDYLKTYSEGKGTIYLGAGTYIWTSTQLDSAESYSDLTIIGLGGVKIQLNANYGFLFQNTISSVLRIRDIHFEVIYSSPTLIGTVFAVSSNLSNTHYVYIEGCVFTNTSTRATYITDNESPTNDAPYWRITNCLFEGTNFTDYAGMVAGYLSDATFIGCRFLMNDFSYMATRTSDTVIKFLDCVFNGGSIGYRLVGVLTVLDNNRGEYFNCRFTDTPIYISGFNPTSLNVFKSCSISTSDTNAFNVINNTVVGNYFANLQVSDTSFSTGTAKTLGFTGVDIDNTLDLTLKITGCLNDFTYTPPADGLTINSSSVIEQTTINRASTDTTLTTNLVDYPNYSTFLTNDMGMMRKVGGVLVQQQPMGSMPIGELWWQNARSLDGATAGVPFSHDMATRYTWYRVTTIDNTDTGLSGLQFTGNSLFREDPSNDGRLQYIGATTCNFHCAVSLCAQGIATHTYEIGIIKNGATSPLAGSVYIFDFTNNSDFTTFASHKVISLATDDTIEISTRSTTHDNDTLDIMNCNIVAMGDKMVMSMM